MEKLTSFPWAKNAAALAVLDAFAAAHVDIRFVGGCVRDALLDMATTKTDCDMATPALPAEVTAILQGAGIKAVPTGIEHGTVTAVKDGEKVEITTLRSDIETDGRHAVVRFGTSWEEDAARRDFTLNALYADADGSIFDYTGGVADARAGRVRFIGIPAARIAEDYLRVLRFFRFSARFGTVPDAEGLEACTAARDGLMQLSAERIWNELGKILCLSKPLRAIQPMIDAGVLPAILPGDYNAARLGRLSDYEHDNYVRAQPVLRLAALCTETEDLQDRLRMSNREAGWLTLATKSLQVRTLRDLRLLWYKHDNLIEPYEWLSNLALVLLADDDVRTPEGDEHRWPTDLYVIATAYDPPVFPLSGADVMAQGVKAGPEVGIYLTLVENWWIEKDFAPKREECLKRLAVCVKP